MSPGRTIIPPLVALWVAACAEEPSTAVGLAGLDEPLDLQLSLPDVSPEMFVTRDFAEFGAPSGPTLVLSSEEPPPEEELDPTTEEAAIWNAYTDLTFWPGQVEAWGEHDYTGNKGRVEVTAQVRHDGLVIGSRTGSKEDTYLFLSPLAHHIIGNVFINIESECGLSADAATAHSAWWEMAPGSGPNVFALTELPTSSGLESQPACEPVAGYASGGGGGGVDDGTVDYTCWMWFTYDELTLEILDIQATWCTGGG